MEYREIVAVTGLGGLYQLLATKSDGAIVRSLADKTTKFISARLHNVTPLESIEVYTTGDNVRLHEVFQKMKDNDSASKIDTKKADNNAIKMYFKDVFPDVDEDRVYVSDMKKMVKWFEILKNNDLLNFESLKQQEEAPAEENTTTEAAVSSEKPAKKSAKKATTEEAAADGEEKPAKKTRAKKTADVEAGEEKPVKKTATRKKKTEE